MVRTGLGVILLTTALGTSVFGAPGVEKILDVAYGPDAMQRLDVYRPKGAKGKRPAVVWIHGGGWREGDKRTGANGISTLAPQLVARGFVAVACNYRLLPGHRPPAQMDDVRRVVRWLRANADAYGIDPDRIGAVGISAGGHLAAVLAVREASTCAGPDGFRGKVQAAVSLNGVTDLRASAPSTPPLVQAVRDFVGDDAKARADASPALFVTKDSAPTLFIVGERDPLVPNGQSTVMAAALAKKGVDTGVLVIEGAGHGIFPSLVPKARDAILEFFAKHLGPTFPG